MTSPFELVRCCPHLPQGAVRYTRGERSEDRTLSQPSLDAGAARFFGFAGLYHGVRPLPPADLGRLLAAYCGGRPELVVDLGSGTGLSAGWARGWADAVVGVEPGDDMRATAEAAAPPGVTYRP